MVHLGVDSIGPLDPDEDGNQHILVIQCSFTRYVELTPLKSVDAKTAARVLFQHFCKYGAPMSIRSDNGKQFCNDILRELFKMVGTAHVRTTAYSHEENGLVERANKEVLRHLRVLVQARRIRDHWGDVVPLVQRIYNTQDCASIGTCPSMLVFGTRLMLDKRIVDAGPEDPGEELATGRWLDNMFHTQERLIRLAQQLQAESLAAFSESHLGQKDVYCVSVGDLVLLIDPAGKGQKISLPLSGPWRCTAIEGDKVTILSLVYNTPRTVFRKCVVPFNYNEAYTDPRLEAMKDKQEFDIAAIVDITGLDQRKRKQVQVKVRWAGYSSEHDSWVDYAEIRDNLIFHQFLRDKSLLFLLPDQAREDGGN
jgi:hypothetical protein